LKKLVSKPPYISNFGGGIDSANFTLIIMNKRTKTNSFSHTCICRSLENLQDLLNTHSISLKSFNYNNSPDSPDSEPNPKEDMNYFLSAMANVKPIQRDRYHRPKAPVKSFQKPVNPGKSDTIRKLRMLIKNGEGFVVSNTPEYMEGTGVHVNPGILKLLHSGHFSIQAHLDLHGYTVNHAREVFNQFLKDSVSTNKRSVLIIHGRGLSSPGKPVLKTSVYRWLTSGPWRKWILAFSSARLCDGGAGATYILLRKRPWSHRLRNNPKK